MEVKIETDSNDAVEIKTEADSKIADYPCVDGPCIGMFGLFHIYRKSSLIFVSFQH